MVLQLASVLEVPLRHQNLMLSAAGFTPIHTETDLSAPQMTLISKAIDFMLRQQEPNPAIVIDRYWNLLLANKGATQLLNIFIDPEKLQKLFYIDGKINLIREYSAKQIHQLSANSLLYCLTNLSSILMFQNSGTLQIDRHKMI